MEMTDSDWKEASIQDNMRSSTSIDCRWCERDMRAHRDARKPRGCVMQEEARVWSLPRYTKNRNSNRIRCRRIQRYDDECYTMDTLTFHQCTYERLV